MYGALAVLQYLRQKERGWPGTSERRLVMSRHRNTAAWLWQEAQRAACGRKRGIRSTHTGTKQTVTEACHVLMPTCAQTSGHPRETEAAGCGPEQKKSAHVLAGREGPPLMACDMHL